MHACRNNQIVYGLDQTRSREIEVKCNSEVPKCKSILQKIKEKLRVVAYL